MKRITRKAYRRVPRRSSRYMPVGCWRILCCLRRRMDRHEIRRCGVGMFLNVRWYRRNLPTPVRTHVELSMIGRRRLERSNLSSVGSRNRPIPCHLFHLGVCCNTSMSIPTRVRMIWLVDVGSRVGPWRRVILPTSPQLLPTLHPLHPGILYHHSLQSDSCCLIPDHGERCLAEYTVSCPSLQACFRAGSTGSYALSASTKGVGQHGRQRCWWYVVARAW